MTTINELQLPVSTHHVKQRRPRRILVIGLRRLGDLLLATALIRSLKRTWPEARLDVLVSAGSEAVLDGNSDVSEVLIFRRSDSIWPLLRRLMGRYDLSVSLQPEDRAQWLALLASRRRASIVPPEGQPGASWKRAINHFWHPVDLHETHAVEQYLRLGDALGIARVTALVPPRTADTRRLDALPGLGDASRPYAILHPSPMYRYKSWPDASWQVLIQALLTRGLDVVLSGGPDPAERERIAHLIAPIQSAPPPSVAGASVHARIIDISGRLRLSELTPLLESCAVYVGPDTSVTHLAAAAGAPTVALFGPSNPSAWGPWPQAWTAASASPWGQTVPLQHHGNVWLLQGTHGRFGACVPCMQEGCDRRRDSVADCLEQLEVRRVLEVLDRVLGDRLGIMSGR